MLGFVGAALLIGGTAFDEGAPLSGMLVAVLASLSWTTGSLYSRTAPLPAPARRRGDGDDDRRRGLLLAGVLRGELPLIRLDEFSARSLIALVYLIAIGSWVGYTSYVWLLRNARTSLVSTYAYVNPVVAVFLGWLILDETITIRTMLAGGVVVVAVAIIISTGARRAGRSRRSRSEPSPRRRSPSPSPRRRRATGARRSRSPARARTRPAAAGPPAAPAR